MWATPVLAVIALLDAAVSVLIWVQVWKSWRVGEAGVRGLTFDRQKQPGLFWLVVATYAFAATSGAWFSIFLFSMILRYGIK